MQVLFAAVVGGVFAAVMFSARKWKAKRDKRRMEQLEEMDRLERAGSLSLSKTDADKKNAR